MGPSTPDWPSHSRLDAACLHDCVSVGIVKWGGGRTFLLTRERRQGRPRDDNRPASRINITQYR